MICKYCSVETNLKGGAHSNHSRWCASNPNLAENKEKTRSKLGIARSKIRNRRNQHSKAALEGKKIEVSEETRQKILKSSLGRRHSEETKESLRIKRIEWLKQNPDLHPWKRLDKFKSVPCEVLKKKLTEFGLDFFEEFQPMSDRAFSLDIAFPDKKIAIEVNGEQHYNRDGSLKTYYRERHELIEKSGWRVVEIHYAKCYDENFFESLLEEIISAPVA